MVNVIVPVWDMVTMDTRAGDLLNHGGCWGSRALASPSPPASPPPAGAAGGPGELAGVHRCPPYPLRAVLGLPALPALPALPWPGSYPLAALGTLEAPRLQALQARTHSASLKFGMDRILADDGCGPNARRGEPTGCSRLGCGTQMSLGEITYPGLLAPTPLRIYGHTTDTGSRALSSPLPTGSGGKRKRSWSRAVFSNLQRKGLEKRFQLQKYITKPDRRQLAATLGLTDAQVKVWFQNRRMKWRHTKESKQQTPLVEDLQDVTKSDIPSSN